MWLYILILLIVVVFILLYTNNQYIKFKVDDKEYHIEQYSPARYESLDTLVQIRQKLDKLVNYMLKKYPNDPKVERMQRRFKNTVLQEANPEKGDSSHTSYTINKGETMVICLRSEKNNLVDMNTLMYVAIHELAHIYSSSYNHSPEFWKNMAFMINEAEILGIYKKTNYHQNPVHYCGIIISSNIPETNNQTGGSQFSSEQTTVAHVMSRSYLQ